MPGPVIKDPTPEWLKPENASVLDSKATKALRWIASVIGADSPTSQVMGLMSTMVPSAGKVGGLVGKVTEAIKGIKAYHGSPHDFDKFSMEKIGTGEGAQAYGHGLYFAETEGTAKAYRDNLTQMRVGAAQRQLQQHGGNINAATTAARSEIDRLKALPNAGGDVARRDGLIAIQEGKLAELKALQDSGSMSKGRMYEVNIKADPESFLDWDKPLSQQHPKVKAYVNQTYAPRLVARDVGNGMVDVMEKGGGSLGVFTKEKAAEVMRSPADYYPYKGDALYQNIAHDLQGDSYVKGQGHQLGIMDAKTQLSASMKQAGIPGIKYLDQGSRAAGEGSRNYVVFDDSIVDILKKYGLLPAAVGGGAAMQPEGR